MLLFLQHAQEVLLIDEHHLISPSVTLGPNRFVLDTGMDPQHAEMSSGPVRRLVSNVWDHFSTDPSCSPVCPGSGSQINNDVNGHGSHVAGTVGGLTVGVAPGANIFGLKVLSDAGYGSFGPMVRTRCFPMMTCFNDFALITRFASPQRSRPSTG